MPDAMLAKAVERLSDLYTTDRGRLAHEQADAAHLAAKREYFLASDAPKVALALEECAVRSDAFARVATLERVRVVDFGAGVGATSVGFLAWLAGARAARGFTTPARVEFQAVELGVPAARAYETAVRAAAKAARVETVVSVDARDFRTASVPACDLILCQTAINELLTGERHSAATVDLVAGWARLAPLLVIEPALRTTTRALMALRDDLLARGGSHVVAPCLHQARCPMLAREGDWCHEARRIEPTPRVARIDRIVGRRDERALFAFLATAPGAAPAPPAQGVAEPRVRLVTDTLGSRGKTERLVCRSDGELRLMRLLDRETTEANRGFLEAERGAVLAITPLPPNDRISPAATVQQQPPG
ncbi:MAG: hypothetical protein RLY21_1622 [Planctomycetota bacterium]